ncbi:MAG: 2-dehydropantoate 2-reductase [Eubacteriales bacterium]|nr:2-dehydropantoate 2-reductase [Eubacteriales bacterium]
MQYVIIGAGGTGGTVGAYMTKAGKDVTLIARGKHLEAMQKNGITLEHLWNGTQEKIPVKASGMEEYQGHPDVILVCVKGYSLEDTIPFIRRISVAHTVVIPILNIYGTGGRLQEKLPDILVTDGCIYVSANIKEPGVIVQHGEILRIVFGTRRPEEAVPVLEKIAEDFQESGIRGILSENIQRDALQKFSYVSPMGAAALYYNAAAGDFQKEGAPREMFKAMIREIVALAEAMDIHFEEDLVETNLNILSTLAPEATTSMQRDVMAGKQSEIDGLVFEVVRLGKAYGVPTPEYEKAAIRLSSRE